MIQVQNLSKRYRMYARPTDRVREWLARGKQKYHTEFWALQDVSFEVPSGSVFGIIGMNGAGKSTLLKILTGTTRATSGSAKTEGRVAALLELGTGFHNDLTGRQNVLLNGKLLGLTGDEIAARVDDIAAFSELGDFFEKPVRTYSSGMYVRLAFSLASSVDPDILIIDEALSVGDAYFQQKCLARIRSFKERGTTILFVSHDPAAVRLLCDRVALLSAGKLVTVGTAQDILELYNAEIARRDGPGQSYVVRRGERDSRGQQRLESGNLKAEIVGVALADGGGARAQAVTAGQRGNIAVDVRFHETIENPTVGILIRDRLGYDIFGTNTAELGIDTGLCRSGTQRRVEFDCQMNLGPGDYTITAAAHASTTHIAECYQWVDRILTFQVLPRVDSRFLGVSFLDPKVTLNDL